MVPSPPQQLKRWLEQEGVEVPMKIKTDLVSGLIVPLPAQGLAIFRQ